MRPPCRKTLPCWILPKTISDLQNVSGVFERMACRKTQWLPYYYAALANKPGLAGRPDVKDKDANAEKIKALLTKAQAMRAIPNGWP